MQEYQANSYPFFAAPPKNRGIEAKKSEKKMLTSEADLCPTTVPCHHTHTSQEAKDDKRMKLKKEETFLSKENNAIENTLATLK